MPEDSLLKAHILLVEDYAANVLVATTLLDYFGCTYAIAENGEEAFALIKTDIFDMVFMDVQMPIMDGFAATGLIRIWEKEQAALANIIIGITARALMGDRDTCINAGMDDYMSKPYMPNTFHDMIEKYAKVPPEQAVEA